MAKRKINFDMVEIPSPEKTTLKDVLGTKAETTPQVLATTLKNGVYEIIPQSDFSKRKMSEIHTVLPVQSDLVDGGVYENYLNQDLALIGQHFMSEFPDIIGKDVIIDDDGWIQFINFPLPEFAVINGRKIFYKTDSDNMVIIIDQYPSFPPLGVHFHESSPNISIFQEVLKSHLFNGVAIGGESYKRRIEELENKGWKWICFHYRNSTWKFNRKYIKDGDCLYKYIEFLHARLSGASV